MDADALFELDESPPREAVAPELDPIPDMTDLDSLTQAEYAKRPALAPFSRTPLSYSLAMRHGCNSAVRAQMSALDQLRERATA